jgi:hypothetical protein
LILLSWEFYHYTSQRAEKEGTREMITEQIEIEHEMFVEQIEIEHEGIASLSCQRPRRILEIMLDVVAFHDFAGYQVQLDNLCRGNYEVGKLVYGNHLVKEVGERTEFVTMSRDIECINDAFVKVIAMFHEYKSKDEFVKSWERKYFRDIPDHSVYRNIYYLGKKVKVWEFGDDSSQFESEYSEGRRKDHVAFYSNRAQFHKSLLEEFWILLRTMFMHYSLLMRLRYGHKLIVTIAAVKALTLGSVGVRKIS